MKCLQCNTIKPKFYYCCDSEKFYCFQCSNIPCPSCNKKRYNPHKKDNNLKQSGIKNTCIECGNSFFSKDVYFFGKCQHYNCVPCLLKKAINATFQRFQDDQHQNNLLRSISCNCSIKSTENLQTFFSNYCFSCGNKLDEKHINLRNGAKISVECYNYILYTRSKENQIQDECALNRRNLQRLLWNCSECKNLIDGVDRVIGTVSKGMATCKICWQKHQKKYQNNALRKIQESTKKMSEFKDEDNNNEIKKVLKQETQQHFQIQNVRIHSNLGAKRQSDKQDDFSKIQVIKPKNEARVQCPNCGVFQLKQKLVKLDEDCYFCGKCFKQLSGSQKMHDELKLQKNLSQRKSSKQSKSKREIIIPVFQSFQQKICLICHKTYKIHSDDSKMKDESQIDICKKCVTVQLNESQKFTYSNKKSKSNDNEEQQRVQEYEGYIMSLKNLNMSSSNIRLPPLPPEQMEKLSIIGSSIKFSFEELRQEKIQQIRSRIIGESMIEESVFEINLVLERRHDQTMNCSSCGYILAVEEMLFNEDRQKNRNKQCRFCFLQSKIRKINKARQHYQ